MTSWIFHAAVSNSELGSGGHNGLKNLQARLGTPNFYRLRLVLIIRATVI